MVILDIKMPESCDYCPLSNYYPQSMRVWCNGEERILAERYDPMTSDPIKKPEWCPLKEVEDESSN